MKHCRHQLNLNKHDRHKVKYIKAKIDSNTSLITTQFLSQNIDSYPSLIIDNIYSASSNIFFLQTSTKRLLLQQ